MASSKGLFHLKSFINLLQELINHTVHKAKI